MDSWRVNPSLTAQEFGILNVQLRKGRDELVVGSSQLAGSPNFIKDLRLAYKGRVICSVRHHVSGALLSIRASIICLFSGRKCYPAVFFCQLLTALFVFDSTI